MHLEKITIKIRQEKVISALDLTINPGEIFVLMGPSGSGKTTLLKGIAGLLPLDSGKLIWKKGNGTTGLVFQEPRLFPHLTVLENIAFGLRVKGMPTKERRNQASDFLKSLQLDNLENRYPHQLSGGQQQRVSLGRALILNPDLLLLDEPFASLDTTLREELIAWLYQLQRKLGFSILWVTHYLDEAFSIADRIGILLGGTLQQVGSPSDLFQQPSSERIAQFLALPNRFSKEQWQSLFQCEFKDLPNKNRGWLDSNHVRLIDEESKSPDLHACSIVGVITKVRPSREGYSLTVTCNNVSVDVNTMGWKKVPKLQEKVRLSVKLDQIHWYSE